MQRRKFVIGMGALAAGSAAAVGSGAFSSVEADRELSVTIADDADAFLGLSTSSPYAREEDGVLELTFNEDADGDDGVPEGDGINPNATTVFRDVFEITNQGTQEIQVYVEAPDGVRLFSESYPDQDNGSDEDAGTPIDDEYWPGGGTVRGDPAEEWAAEDDNSDRDTPLVVPVGEALSEITVSIDSSVYDTDDDEITIYARAEDDY